MMTNNFISLEQIDESVVLVNASFIESIEQMSRYTIVTMSFGSGMTYRVIETPEQIIKKIEDTGTFKTIFK
jgi:uncharacterized protein YlzI (FlbEa/FlbD family)